MKKSKRLITLFLAISLVLGLLPSMAESKSFDLSPDLHYGFQFKSNSSIKEISLYIEKASASRSKLNMALYPWAGTYSKTVNSDPIAEETFEKFSRNTWLTMAVDKQERGEFLLIFVSQASSAQVLVEPDDKGLIRSYESASPIKGNFNIKINGGNIELEKFSDQEETFITTPDNWTYIDGLGRESPNYGDVREKRDDRFVGIFFHTWHARFASNSFANITEILKENLEQKDFSKINWGNKYSYFWNEPLWGYYDTQDKWVIRKQAELLADAGVDVIIMDNTNATDIFKEGVIAILETFSQARADGVRTPQLSFMLPMFNLSDVVSQLKQLYELIYSNERYQDLWFYWKGKPLIMGNPDFLLISKEDEAAILELFTFRPANASYREDYAQIFDEQGNVKVYIRPPEGHISWQWITVMPQQVAYNDDGSPEQVCVSVAQNWSKEQGLTAMSSSKQDQLFGRSYSHLLGKHDDRENAKLYGKNIEEQWEYALKVDPEFIYITGWNEWRAGLNAEIWGEKNAFADTFDDNNSRDLEPSKGDLKDHYYYQMVSYIRRYKGIAKPQEASEMTTIDINGSLDQWDNVGPYFASYPGNTLARDSKGYGTSYYTQDEGLNDIVGAKVARDKENLYFYVETLKNLQASDKDNFMRLFIEVVDKKHTDAANWESFHYVVNRTKLTDKALLEKSTGGWNFEEVAKVDYSIKDNVLQIKIPKSLLQIDSDKFTINFKWSDGMEEEGDIMDFYTHGDCAPGGRFKYNYTTLEIKAKSSSKPIFFLAGGLLLTALAGTTIFLITKKKKAK